MKRISSIDFTRGLVMIIMALDHTRDILHVTSVTQSPTDLATTSPALFFTRWITHLCAPTFVFLSGCSAWLSFKNKNSVAASRQFLLSRGAWLIVLEFTLVNFGIWFDVHFSTFIFDVIAAIGFGFIILGLLINLNRKIILAIGLAILFLHGLLPLIPLGETTLPKNIFTALFSPAAFSLSPKTLLIIGYPPLPWLGIMLVGFGAGSLFQLPVITRKNIFLKIGLASIALFIVVRFINVYGDTAPWTTQKNGLYTFLSFINFTKYPPSLIFCLGTLGCMFLILAFVEGVQNKFTEVVDVYGKIPLFYFLIHWYIIHPLMFLIVFMQGYKTSDLVFGFNLGRPKGPSGVPLWGVYLIWIAVVLLLYPVCKWYGRYKMRHKEKKWLRYL